METKTKNKTEIIFNEYSDQVQVLNIQKKHFNDKRNLQSDHESQYVSNKKSKIKTFD